MGLERFSSRIEGLRAHLDTALPPVLPVGKGTVLCLTGWCYHATRKILQLTIRANDSEYPVKAYGLYRPDVFRAQNTTEDPHGLSQASGFWVLVPLYAGTTGQVDLSIVADVEGGYQAESWLGTINATKQLAPPAWLLPAIERFPRHSSPTISICMATHNPDISLFTRQVESLIAQTYQDWICIISDDSSPTEKYFWLREIVARDPRFFTTRSTRRLGFYHNFEHALSLVPAWCDFVCLSDQDDRWHPRKLETLLSGFNDESTSLVYSDMNIVSEDGTLISPTYWTKRRNNYEDLASMLLANTVTGAAAMVRRSILSSILPFPMRIGDSFHDHWIACVALTLGRIEYIDKPLHDYVQHGDNVLGHFAPNEDGKKSEIRRFLRAIPGSRSGRLARMARWEAIYFNDFLRLQLIAKTLELRSTEVHPKKRRALRRMAKVDESVSAAAWLVTRGLSRRHRLTTLGAEDRLTGALLWRHSTPTPSAPDTRALEARRQSNHSTNGRHPALERVKVMREKIAPITLRVTPGAPARVNLLLPTIDPRYVFGGYLTKFNLARRLAERGVKVRLVIVDHCEFKPDEWRSSFARFSGLEQLFDLCEVTYAFDRQRTLEVSAGDAFIATTWWTAHIAHHACVELGQSRFVYLIQEYEPFTFSMGSFSALAIESYSFPHFAVFSTELLRTYFRNNGIGVFAEGKNVSEKNSIAFQNAITDVGRIRERDMRQRRIKRLLFYARPEEHAARNMFELGCLALDAAVAGGHFRGEWRFTGIGTVGNSHVVPLGDGASLDLLPRQTPDTYRDVLRSHDLGLALMHTPHPSLVPIEMASAGMLVVTTTYANKTRSKLQAISPNIIGVEPTLEGIKKGLREAVSRVSDYKARVRGSRVSWSRKWSDSFDGHVLDRVEAFLAASSRSPTTLQSVQSDNA